MYVSEMSVETLFKQGSSNDNSLWLYLQRYPGTLLFYALGLGAIEADRLRFLGRLFS